jgi:guanyl-specific ribonuclease Sa
MTLNACFVGGMQENPSKSIRQMVKRMPQWLRVDLSSSDALLRGRAEGALSAMIVAAIDATKPANATTLPIDGEPTHSASI